MRRNAEVVSPQGHATDVFTEWACQYLDERSKSREPFFLYLAYNAPHDPIQPKPDWRAKVCQREPGISENRARLVALIEHLDDGIGQVLDTLDRLGLTQNTLVAFSSDNGGLLEVGANNGPWRSGKQHVYEGGLRVPFAIKWPGHIRPGSRSQRNTLTMDLFPTVLEAAGVKPPAGIDGVSFLATLKGEPEPALERNLYFVWREGGARYGGKTIEALRQGDWKLLQDSPFAPMELYNLKDDPQETTDLAKKQEKLLNSLDAALRRQIRRGGAVPWQPPEQYVTSADVCRTAQPYVARPKPRMYLESVHFLESLAW
jgi:arylsulfatase A-like enzyme